MQHLCPEEDFSTQTISQKTSQVSSTASQVSSLDDEKTHRGIGRGYAKKNRQGSIDVMTERVVMAFNDAGVSYRQSVHLIAAIAEALGYDLKDVITNKSGYHRRRQNIRKELAEKRKLLFENGKIKAGVLHCDGKLMFDGLDSKKVDRVYFNYEWKN